MHMRCDRAPQSERSEERASESELAAPASADCTNATERNPYYIPETQTQTGGAAVGWDVNGERVDACKALLLR